MELVPLNFSTDYEEWKDDGYHFKLLASMSLRGGLCGKLKLVRIVGAGESKIRAPKHQRRLAQYRDYTFIIGCNE